MSQAKSDVHFLGSEKEDLRAKAKAQSKVDGRLFHVSRFDHWGSGAHGRSPVSFVWLSPLGFFQEGVKLYRLQRLQAGEWPLFGGQTQVGFQIGR